MGKFKSPTINHNSTFNTSKRASVIQYNSIQYSTVQYNIVQFLKYGVHT